MTPVEFAGRPRIVVIGGSSGIGAATARLAHDAGCAVVVVSRHAEQADVPGKKVSIDMADIAAVEAWFAAAGPIDYLVAAPSAHASGSLAELDLDAARHAFDVKLWGPLAAIRSADVRQAVVLVSGIAAISPWRDGLSVGPSALCGAVEATARCLALALAPVRVNAVSPGVVDTPLYADMPEALRSEIYHRHAAALPVGEIGTPADVAKAIWSLLTNPFITATTLYVDGGHRLVSP